MRLIAGVILLGSVLPNALTAGHGYYFIAQGMSRERQTQADDPAHSGGHLASHHRPAQLNCPLGTHRPSAEERPASTRQKADGPGAGNKEHDHIGYMVTVANPSELRSLKDAFTLYVSDAVLGPLPPDTLIIADAPAATIDHPPRSL